VSWARGTTHAIIWLTIGPLGGRFDLKLLNGGAPVATIATAVPGRPFLWKVFTNLRPGGRFEIEVVSNAVNTVAGSSAFFYIK